MWASGKGMKVPKFCGRRRHILHLWTLAPMHRCVCDYVIIGVFVFNQCFFHGILTITTKENQYNKKSMCVKVLYL